MPLPRGEPATAEAVEEWIERKSFSADRFRHVAQASDEHRAHHHCDVHPSSDGPLLGVIAASSGARRLLEVGCGLGYSALWLASGAGPRGHVETIERSHEHAELARKNFKAQKMTARIKVLEGSAAPVLRGLTGRYDLIYFDGDPAESLDDLKHFERLLKPGGVLVSANLFLGMYDPNILGLKKSAEYRERIVSSNRWLTTFLRLGTKAISIRR